MRGDSLNWCCHAKQQLIKLTGNTNQEMECCFQQQLESHNSPNKLTVLKHYSKVK